MRQLFRATIIAAIVMMGLTLMVSGCSQGESKQSKKKKLPLVMVKAIKRDNISRIMEATGEIVATNSITISATVEGPIGFCPWREGDVVKKRGQKLIEIDRAMYQEEVRTAAAALDVARAKLDDLQAGSRPEEIAQAEQRVVELKESKAFAKSDMERTAKLVESGSLPGESYEKAKVAYVTLKTKLAAARERLAMLKVGPTKTAIAVQQALVREAENKLALARARLAECSLSAPFKGVITRVYVHQGDMATLKSPLLKMIDLSSLVIRFDIPEAQALSVRQGMQVQVYMDAYQGQTFQAKISRLYPELNPRMRTRTAEATIQDDIDLVPGMFARLKVTLMTVKGATVAPVRAVVLTLKGGRVAYIIEQGRAIQRRIKTGIEEAGLVQILSGLEPGEKVVVAGYEKLKNGQPVRWPGTPASRPKQIGGAGR